MPTKIAAYSGSFRPLHYGHLDVIRRAASLFDKLMVIVVANASKEQVFSLGERAHVVRETCRDIPNLSVLTSEKRYAVRVAHEHGARCLVRGIRDHDDLPSEIRLANANRRICPDVETIFIPSRPELSEISSSAVWQHVGADPDWEREVARLIPAASLELVCRYWCTRTAT